MKMTSKAKLHRLLYVHMPPTVLLVLCTVMCPCVMAIPVPVTLLTETMKRIDVSDLHGKLIPVDLLLMLVLIYFGKRLREHSKKVKWERKYRKRPFFDPAEHQCVYFTYPVPGSKPSFRPSSATMGSEPGTKCTIEEITADSLHAYEHLPSLP
ncbi:uncharacterized protein LOC110975219 [Acanthaster planci]|uniref:Uncharacterized protein LOC110975219 n=1 Tax=Acanthaster planci TaxID=133434 RepID=A0A8B7XSL3_ACAPL|nr:uncharacterized protein LOC110975219 [Acanthaster planci]